jgi:hypothetical protein
MTSTDLTQQGINDLIQQRAKECRRLAGAARNAGDKMFWLQLVKRWQAVESVPAERPVDGRASLIRVNAPAVPIS